MTISNEHRQSYTIERALRTVAVVTKQPRPDVLDAVLDVGDYDVVFVESLDRAYSHIKRVSPHLVIVCLEIDETEGFQVLSMLKLDSATSRIPVLTYLMSPDAKPFSDDFLEPDRLGSSQPVVVSMN